MVTRVVVQSAVHTAATALAHLPAEEWAGWVAYLCESLEEIARAQGQDFDFNEVLAKTRAALQERVERGSW